MTPIPRSLKFLSKPQALAFWLSLLLFSLFSLFAMGRSGVDILIYGLWLFISLWIIKLLTNKGFLLYIGFIFILSGFYLPIAISYGELNLGSIVSFYETNRTEASEFMMQMASVENISAFIAYLALFAILCRLNKYVASSANKKKMTIIFILIVVLPIVQKPIKDIYEKRSVSVNTLSKILYYPVRFVTDIVYFHHKYATHQQKLQQSKMLTPSWEISDTHLSYNNYVLIIGESMRKDYMSAYGYPVDTTPFLASVNATVFNNYIAPGYNTVTSLQRMLFQNRPIENFTYENTIITLANSANLDTYWLSNQGQYGDYEVLASSVGMKANKSLFLKKGEYNDEGKTDLALLPELERALNDSGEHKLIVLHLLGSHSNFCNRLSNNYAVENIENLISTDMSCYLSSFKQTDKLIKQVYNVLKQQNKPFSLMYLSDHGLSNKERSLQGMTLQHDGQYQQNYQIPLIVMSSNDTKRTYIDTPRSGYQFINGFAEWLGINEPTLRLDMPFFSNQPIIPIDKIQVFDGNEVVNYQSLKDDPRVLE